MTIRLNEKNTTVLTKVLNWILKLFLQLKAIEYNMDDFEALALLPHIIGKLGESREEVRNTVLEILQTIIFLYSEKKTMEQILNGATSKNSRQRYV